MNKKDTNEVKKVKVLCADGKYKEVEVKLTYKPDKLFVWDDSYRKGIE